MIALDTNLLVYAHREDSPFHPAALHAVTGLAEGRNSWAIPWPCLHEFFAIVTHPRVYAPPTPVEAALAQIDAWLESSSLLLLSETGQHWEKLRALIASANLHGPTVHDARIAALCLGHGVRELWTADRDFSRFPSLRLRNPLVASTS